MSETELFDTKFLKKQTEMMKEELIKEIKEKFQTENEQFIRTYLDYLRAQSELTLLMLVMNIPGENK